MAAFWENVNSGKLVGASQLASSLVLLSLSLSLCPFATKWQRPPRLNLHFPSVRLVVWVANVVVVGVVVVVVVLASVRTRAAGIGNLSRLMAEICSRLK